MQSQLKPAASSPSPSPGPHLGQPSGCQLCRVEGGHRAGIGHLALGPLLETISCQPSPAAVNASVKWDSSFHPDAAVVKITSNHEIKSI